MAARGRDAHHTYDGAGRPLQEYDSHQHGAIPAGVGRLGYVIKDYGGHRVVEKRPVDPRLMQLTGHPYDDRMFERFPNSTSVYRKHRVHLPTDGRFFI